MTETIIAAIIGAAISLITTMLTLVVNAAIEKSKVQAERQQRKEEAKREKLKHSWNDKHGILLQNECITFCRRIFLWKEKLMLLMILTEER